MEPGYISYGSRYACQRNDPDARNDAPIDDPFVSHRVLVWPNEEQGNHQMRKGQPIESIEQERIAIMCFLNAIPNAVEPELHGGAGREGLLFMNELQFCVNGKGGDAAERKHYHKKDNEGADAAEGFSRVHVV